MRPRGRDHPPPARPATPHWTALLPLSQFRLPCTSGQDDSQSDRSVSCEVTQRLSAKKRSGGLCRAFKRPDTSWLSVARIFAPWGTLAHPPVFLANVPEGGRGSGRSPNARCNFGAKAS